MCFSFALFFLQVWFFPLAVMTVQPMRNLPKIWPSTRKKKQLSSMSKSPLQRHSQCTIWICSQKQHHCACKCSCQCQPTVHYWLNMKYRVMVIFDFIWQTELKIEENYNRFAHPSTHRLCYKTEHFLPQFVYVRLLETYKFYLYLFISIIN